LCSSFPVGVQVKHPCNRTQWIYNLTCFIFTFLIAHFTHILIAECKVKQGMLLYSAVSEFFFITITVQSRKVYYLHTLFMSLHHCKKYKIFKF
jgi:hypothetical membrane protein